MSLNFMKHLGSERKKTLFSKAEIPVLKYVLSQVVFWMVANVSFSIIVHLIIRLAGYFHTLPEQSHFLTITVIPLILGGIYGIAIGFIDYYLEWVFSKTYSLWKLTLLRTITSIILFLLMFLILRLFLFDLIIRPPLPKDQSPLGGRGWGVVFCLFLMLYFLSGLTINFINQVSRMFGPGVLLPVFFGRYRQPKEENRIFMFMDLKASTTIAESLGHKRYSEFIRDSFLDINACLRPFKARIYQYVGDEVVLTWKIAEGVQKAACIRFFFACEGRFLQKQMWYIKQFGFVPEFKAGVHCGLVTAVEIGNVKRDIAYHGDTVNTASRLQSLCKAYNKRLIISEELLTRLTLPSNYPLDLFGKVVLDGRGVPIGVVAVGRVNDQPQRHEN